MATYTLTRRFTSDSSIILKPGTAYTITSTVIIYAYSDYDANFKLVRADGSTYTDTIYAGEHTTLPRAYWYNTESVMTVDADVELFIQSADRILTVSVGGDWDMEGGKVTRKANCIESLTATCYPNFRGWSFVVPRSTALTVKRGDTIIFDGRVLKYEPAMDSSGLPSRTLTCEGVFGYLQDTTMPYLYERSWKDQGDGTDVQNFVDYILGIHNGKCETWKQIQRGEVDVALSGTTVLVRGINRETAFAALQEKLVSPLGGEMRVRRGTDGLLYLDYKTQLGVKSTTAITVGRNMVSCSEEIDPGDVVSAMIPLGKRKGSITYTDTTKISEYESDDRITVADANGGSEIVKDASALKKYGYIEKCVTFDDYETASDLLVAAKAWLATNNAVESTVKVDALDLSLIGEEADSIELYGIYQCTNSLTGTNAELEVVSQTVSIDSPEESTAEFGRVGSTQSASISASSGGGGSSSADNIPAINALSTVASSSQTGAKAGYGPLPIYAGGQWLADTTSSALITNASRYIKNANYSTSSTYIGGFSVKKGTAVRVSVSATLGIESGATPLTARLYLATAKTEDLPAKLSTAVDYTAFTATGSGGYTTIPAITDTSALVSFKLPAGSGTYAITKDLATAPISFGEGIVAKSDSEYYLFCEITSGGTRGVYVLDGMVSMDLVKTKSDA